MNDKSIIDEQIDYVCNNYYKDKNIGLCNKIRNDTRFYGTPFFIKEDRYEESYLKVFESNQFFAILKDQSLINICYSFDEKGNVVEHVLSFIPPVNTKSYIRIDYHKNKKDSHYKAHLHILPKKDNCRIPVSKVVLPHDFLFFVLKYFYSDNTNFVNSLKTGKGSDVLDNGIKLYLAIGH